MNYRHRYSPSLDVYRIWKDDEWIADAHSLFNAEMIVNALCSTTLDNSSAESKPVPSPSTNGSNPHSTPDAIEPPSSVQQPSQNCSQAGSDNLAEMSTTRNSEAAAAIMAAMEGKCGRCWKCLKNKGLVTHMILCPTCGNKRCPHASDCSLECTGSNDIGQKGSVYA